MFEWNREGNSFEQTKFIFCKRRDLTPAQSHKHNNLVFQIKQTPVAFRGSNSTQSFSPFGLHDSEQ